MPYAVENAVEYGGLGSGAESLSPLGFGIDQGKMCRVLMKCEQAQVDARRDVASEIVTVGCDKVIGDGGSCIDNEDGTVLACPTNALEVGADGSSKAVGTECLGSFVAVAEWRGC